MSDVMAPITGVDMQGYVGSVQFGGGDRRMIVWFFTKAVQMNAQSEEAGRPIFEDRHFVHIQQPGERDFQEREATMSDQQRWPDKWQAYLNQREQLDEGTPLSTLFPSEPAIVEMLRALKVHTAEQLANLTETGIQRIGMGARSYVDRAKRYLQEAALSAPFSKMQAELDAKDGQIAALTEQLRQAVARIERLEAEDTDQPRPSRRQRSADA